MKNPDLNFGKKKRNFFIGVDCSDRHNANVIHDIAFNQELKNGFFKKLIIKFVNKFPNHYDLYLSHFFHLDDITFNLKNL